MGIERRLPNSDETRLIALNGAKTKKDNTPSPDIVIRPATIARLDADQPVYASNMQARGTALAGQSTATDTKFAAQERARMFVSHFIQAFNNGVDRGLFPRAHRAFYGLDVNSGSVPEINSEPLLTLWGQRLIDGDPLRIAAGGAPMAMPAIAEVITEYTAFLNANIAQSTAKDAYDNAQEAVSDLEIATDKLILRIWDEVETAFNDEPISSKRRKSREWGVVYISTDPATVSGRAVHAVTGNPVEGVEVLLAETGVLALTDSAGNYNFKTNHTGEGTIRYSLAGFTTQTFLRTFEGGDTFVIDVSMVPV